MNGMEVYPAYRVAPPAGRVAVELDRGKAMGVINARSLAGD
jgi:hypothetical protein